MADTSQVGPQTLPVPTAGQDSPLHDLVVVGLLDCLGFWLKANLDGKLGEMRGPIDGTAITDACPTAHRFPWFHEDTFTRALPGQTEEPLPALYGWCEDSQRLQGTLYWDFLKRKIKIQYIFPELQIPWGIGSRSGIAATVERSFAKAAERFMRHDSYGFNGDPVGTPLATTLNVTNIIFEGGRPGRLDPKPHGSAHSGRSSAAGHVQRAYAAYEGTFTVYERIEARDEEPGDTLGTSTGTIAVDTETTGLDLLSRTLTPPE